MAGKKKGRARRAPRSKPRAALVERLVMAMDRCALTRGEAQWTNGYRARFEADIKRMSLTGADNAEAERLYEKQQRQWAENAKAEKRFKRIAQEVVRASQRKHSKRGDGNG